MEIHRLDPLPSLVYSKSSTWSILVDRKNPQGGKVWSEPDFNLAYLGGSKNPHGGNEAWSEQNFTLVYLGGSKNPHGGKEVWSEPDFNLAYLGGSKNPHGGKEAWSEPDFNLAYFSGSKNPHGGKEVWSEPDFDLAYSGGSEKKKTRYKASGNIREYEILVKIQAFRSNFTKIDGDRGEFSDKEVFLIGKKL